MSNDMMRIGLIVVSLPKIVDETASKVGPKIRPLLVFISERLQSMIELLFESNHFKPTFTGSFINLLKTTDGVLANAREQLEEIRSDVENKSGGDGASIFPTTVLDFVVSLQILNHPEAKEENGPMILTRALRRFYYGLKCEARLLEKTEWGAKASAILLLLDKLPLGSPILVPEISAVHPVERADIQRQTNRFSLVAEALLAMLELPPFTTGFTPVQLAVLGTNLMMIRSSLSRLSERAA